MVDTARKHPKTAWKYMKKALKCVALSENALETD